MRTVLDNCAVRPSTFWISFPTCRSDTSIIHKMSTRRAQQEKRIGEWSVKTKLHKQVVKSLSELYHQNCKDNKGFDNKALRDVLMNHFGILDDFILGRIYRAFDASANTSYLKEDDFVLGMGTFLTSALDEKIKFCFDVYDLNGDGYISREEMFQLLKGCMVTKSHDADQDDADESIKELTELVLKMLDMDHDMRVSLPDFQKAVQNNTLFLEVLGRCLPDEKCRCHFLLMLGDPDLSAPQATISHSKKLSAREKLDHSKHDTGSQRYLKN